VKTLKAIIFDFDGVLADSVPVYKTAVVEAAGEAGITDCTPDDIESADTRTVAQRIIEQYNLDIDVETMAAQIEEFALDRLLTTPRIVPGARKLVESVRQAGLRTAIGSLAPRRNINAVLGQAGMQDLFEAIVAVDDIKKIKPDPEVFLKAAEAIGVAPDECVVIEDADFGIEAALSAGMVAVALTTTLPSDELAAAHYVVPGLGDLSVDTLRRMYREVRGNSGDS